MNIEGLVLESTSPEFQQFIKGPLQTVWRDGYPVQEARILVLAFDRYLCEIDQMAREQEWTDGDKESVSRQLDYLLSNPQYRDCWVHEPPRVAPPWPTYDEVHHNQVPTIALAIGMVAEALTYEQRGRPGGPRPSVVEKLQALLDDPPTEDAEQTHDDAADALTAL